MSDTPKTDAEHPELPPVGLVSVEFARRLERENNELRRFKAAALTLTTEASVNLAMIAMSKEKT